MSAFDETTDATVRASRALLGVVARSVAAALEEVSLPQLRVLVLLAATGPQRSGELAERSGVHPSTFSRTADRMVAGGWIRRVDNPASRREVLVTLTPAGRELVAGIIERRRSEIAGILARVPRRQRAVVLDGMRIFSAAAGEPAAADLLILGV